MPTRKLRIRRSILVTLALGLNLLPLGRDPVNPPRDPAFVIREAPTPASMGDAQDFREELIDPAGGTPVAHVPSLCELPGGRLGAAWYGGAREGHADVAIYFSIRSQADDGGWSPPQAVVTRDSAARELQRYVRKVGNAVVFTGSEGGLWLVYVSVAAGGWSGSSLNLKRSFDEGRTWTPSRRLTLSPFFNISELVKNKPVALAGGGWVLPIYHEAAGKFPELLWLREVPGGVSSAKSRMFGGRTAISAFTGSPGGRRGPGVVPPGGGLARNHALAHHRRGTALVGATIHQPSQSRLGSGCAASFRRPAACWRSTMRQRAVRICASPISNDMALPGRAPPRSRRNPAVNSPIHSLLQTDDGRVHLVYTWQRKGIKHLAFSLAWLNSQGASVTTMRTDFLPYLFSFVWPAAFLLLAVLLRARPPTVAGAPGRRFAVMSALADRNRVDPGRWTSVGSMVHGPVRQLQPAASRVDRSRDRPPRLSTRNCLARTEGAPRCGSGWRRAACSIRWPWAWAAWIPIPLGWSFSWLFVGTERADGAAVVARKPVWSRATVRHRRVSSGAAGIGQLLGLPGRSGLFLDFTGRLAACTFGLGIRAVARDQPAASRRLARERS